MASKGGNMGQTSYTNGQDSTPTGDVVAGINSLAISNSAPSDSSTDEGEQYLRELQDEALRKQAPNQDEEQTKADELALLDRHNRAIAQILSHFNGVVRAATEPLPKTGNVIEHAALNRMTMETETAALISEVQGLAAINREIKSLWIRGPLRKPGEDDGREAQLDHQAKTVSDLFTQALKLRDEAIKREKELKLKAESSSTAASATTGTATENEAEALNGVAEVTQQDGSGKKGKGKAKRRRRRRRHNKNKKKAGNGNGNQAGGNGGDAGGSGATSPPTTKIGS
ncbi:hypothetical protein F5Y04DRAFT_285281 [Hypomontagnella monticulosa]|nr:hypothetical protein F5Y04DRAFT_285281 [Hypomontagnella monticulosa]